MLLLKPFNFKCVIGGIYRGILEKVYLTTGPSSVVGASRAQAWSSRFDFQ